MRILLAQLLVATLSLLGTAYVLPGFRVSGFFNAAFAAIIIGLANIVVRPLLLFLSLPLNILTLGLFTFVVNAIVLKLCAALTPGFEIKGWGNALLGAIIIALLSNAMYWLLAGYAPVY